MIMKVYCIMISTSTFNCKRYFKDNNDYRYISVCWTRIFVELFYVHLDFETEPLEVIIDNVTGRGCTNQYCSVEAVKRTTTWHNLQSIFAFLPSSACYVSYTQSQWSLVIKCLTAVWEDPGSILTAGSCVNHDSHCDIQPWAQAAHPYCSA